MSLKPFQRTKDGYLISSDQTLLDLDAINTALDSPALFWANSLSRPALETMIKNSFCLGLYLHAPANPGLSTPAKPVQIGLSRLVTDHVTFAYLTDVYVEPEYQGNGLGRWLIECTNDVLMDMPELRRAMLLTSTEKLRKMYNDLMKAKKMDPEHDFCLHIIGPKSVENKRSQKTLERKR